MAEPNEESFFKADTDTPPTDSGLSTGVEWQASEFIHHDKSAGWYGALALTALVLSVLVYLLTREVVSVAVVVVGAILMGAYGSRQPRQLDYKIDDRGIQIGQKYHNYGEFRSFSVMPEGAFLSVIFMPLKRFATTTTIYFAPDQQDAIMDILARALPFEEYKPDAVDRLVKSIRF